MARGWRRISRTSRIGCSVERIGRSRFVGCTYPKPTGGRDRSELRRWKTRLSSVQVLNAIYESDFLGYSYGFRRGRSQHQALDALYTGLLTRQVNWVLDLDIRGFFDGISHEW